LGHYKKRIFHRSKKHGFFAVFEMSQKAHVSVNKDGHLVKGAFLVFGPKRVKKGVKINIVSNLP